MGSPTLAAMTECPAAADTPEAEAPAPRRPALSPSRAADFKQCPLLYRFRAIDRLPEVPGRAQVRGTLVHAVLERGSTTCPPPIATPRPPVRWSGRSGPG